MGTTTANNNTMRYLTVLFFFGFSQFLIAQESTQYDSLHSLLKGKWEVAKVEKGFKVSQSVLMSLDQPHRGNYNLALYIFEPDGKFRLESIHDYGSSSETGSYLLSKDGTRIECSVKKTNPISQRDKQKQVTKKNKILLLEKGKLVLRARNKVYYLVRG